MELISKPEIAFALSGVGIVSVIGVYNKLNTQIKDIQNEIDNLKRGVRKETTYPLGVSDENPIKGGNIVDEDVRAMMDDFYDRLEPLEEIINRNKLIVDTHLMEVVNQLAIISERTSRLEKLTNQLINHTGIQIDPHERRIPHLRQIITTPLSSRRETPSSQLYKTQEEDEEDAIAKLVASGK